MAIMCTVHSDSLCVISGKWQRSKYVGVTLVGKTLAVMGFGKVGAEVARRARGLGMDVIAHDPYAAVDRARAIAVDLVSFDEAISTADFISLHMPLTPSTAKLFNDETFAKMKNGVRIINVARGGVVDEEALLRALKNGKVAQVIHFVMSTHIMTHPNADSTQLIPVIQFSYASDIYLTVQCFVRKKRDILAFFLIALWCESGCT